MSEVKSIKVSRVCINCGATFVRYASLLKNPKHGKYCSKACGNSHKIRAPEVRFWEKVNKTESCWLWTGCVDKTGYGILAKNNHEHEERAHRFSWVLRFGPIPDCLQVLHNCPGGDNPTCVNPDHLFLGTNDDNMADMVKKGRSAKGEACARAVLTEEEVREIRIRRAAGEQTKPLGRAFGVSHTLISAI